MYRYLNTRTGVIISVPCPLTGPDWKNITDAEPTTETTPKTAKKTVKKGVGKDE